MRINSAAGCGIPPDLVMLPVTFIAMLFVLGKDEDAVGSFGGIICVYSDDPFGWE